MCSNGFMVCNLQYADDSVLVGVPSIENLLTIKVILKSSLFDVNMNKPFLDLENDFLPYNVDYFPFKY